MRTLPHWPKLIYKPDMDRCGIITTVVAATPCVFSES
jgi:hypothetical protein